MDVIPVIDLKGGVVVHARGGRRDAYRPIETPLSASAAPAAVVAGLRRLFPFPRLYAADLDAIEGRGDHAAALGDLARTGIDIWLDNGARDAAALARWPGTLLLGSESQKDVALLRAVRDDPRVVLSLDFRGEAFLGPPHILADATLWPRRLVVMTLARVGAQAGPDCARLGEILARAEGREVYAAGGVRNAADLRDLAARGVAGALVATALHSGALGAADLHAIARRKGRAMRTA